MIGYSDDWFRLDLLPFYGLILLIQISFAYLVSGFLGWALDRSLNWFSNAPRLVSSPDDLTSEHNVGGFLLNSLYKLIFVNLIIYILKIISDPFNTSQNLSFLIILTKDICIYIAVVYTLRVSWEAMIAYKRSCISGELADAPTDNS